MSHPELGQDPTVTKFSELNTIHSRTATPGPFILASFLCTLQRWISGECLVITHFAALIPTLQHSIRSLGLRATPAGFTPACLQTISSPHVHRMVRSSRLKVVSGYRLIHSIEWRRRLSAYAVDKRVRQNRELGSGTAVTRMLSRTPSVPAVPSLTSRKVSRVELLPAVRTGFPWRLRR
jgi:hypothetical protein